jgi:hypothetical protein
MGRGGKSEIEIGVTADTKPFVTNTKKAQQTLEDFGDALDDVARDGAQSAEKIERSFKDTANAVNNVGKDIKSQSNLGNVGSEIGQEFSQNFGEAVRGGDPAGAIAETFTSLGPAFGIAGVAAAAGAGIILGVIKGAQEKAAEFKAAVEEITSAAFDATVDLAAEAGIGAVLAFQRAWESNAIQEDQVRKALGVDSAAEALNELSRIAGLTGIPIGQLREAILGNEDAQAQVTAAVAATTAELKKQAGPEGYGSVAQADVDRLLAVEKVVEGEKRVKAAKDQTESAAKAADILDETRVERARENARNAERTADAYTTIASKAGLIAANSQAWAANLASGAEAAARASQLGGYGSSPTATASRVRP